MFRDGSGDRFWISLAKSIFEDGKNTYQYLVDGTIKIADPYAHVVLDPWNDDWVPQDVMSELPDYPADFTSGIVTVFDLEPSSFDWQVSDFERPDQTELVIYEILMRDFLEDKNYKSLLDTLNYLDRLGVNAIELMPIQEFEGNQSWGYNPSFHMAVDKYYGSRDQLKMVIDEAHARGIAVILDVVFNHAFSQSPLCQLYWDSANFRPSEDSPYLNVTARHPFNVGYDFNHESQATKYWTKRVLQHWIDEFKFDGFRFDLSKGLTQTNSGSNADQMSQYDASRITILKDYADFIWSFDESLYVILEHFAYNNEETELANYGMMLWGNINHEFNEAAMGYTSDLDWADHKVRGWNDPHLIAYPESHDEERLMYRILEYGDDNGDYNTRELETALERVAAVNTLYMSIPGPKMMWQFVEQGYDFSINRCVNGTINPNCRLDPKPVRWDYLDDPFREKLRQQTENLLYLRNNYPTFHTDDYVFNDGNFFLKTVHLNHPEMDAVTLINYRVINSDINPKFPYEGDWYEYFTGDSLTVVNTQEKLTFSPGEYRIYTSQPITPPGGVVTSIHDLTEIISIDVFPNPVGVGQVIQLPELSSSKRVEWINAVGQVVRNYTTNESTILVSDKLTPGLYHLKITELDTYQSHLARVVVK